MGLQRRSEGGFNQCGEYIAVGVDIEGVKQALRIWKQAAEGVKFGASVCAQLANRCLKNVLIVCCDGLAGFPEAIGRFGPALWAESTLTQLDPSFHALRRLR